MSIFLSALPNFLIGLVSLMYDTNFLSASAAVFTASPTLSNALSIPPSSTSFSLSSESLSSRLAVRSRIDLFDPDGLNALNKEETPLAICLTALPITLPMILITENTPLKLRFSLSAVSSLIFSFSVSLWNPAIIL